MAKIDYKAGDKDIRPWGSWEVIDVGDAYVTKRIIIQPGQMTSLQYHDHRDEKWTIVKGEGSVTFQDKTYSLFAGETVLIPAGIHHRIANNTEQILEFIEIQTGSILNESDITRIEDHYGRA